MYKVYATGKEFLNENLELIRKDPLGAMFFEANANSIGQCDVDNYAIRVEVEGEILIAIRAHGYPFVIYGSENCVVELAKIVAKNKLQFSKVIGYFGVSDKFLSAYEAIVGGSHKINLSMDVMYCENVTPCDTTEVEQATPNDAEEITRLFVAFLSEAMGENSTWGEKIDKIKQNIQSFALLRADENIASIACTCESGKGLCRISEVYTKPEYRNRGYSRKVVTYLTEQIIASGNLPCLHVDQHNPVSNHLYQKIGYKYGKSRYEFGYEKA